MKNVANMIITTFVKENIILHQILTSREWNCNKNGKSEIGDYIEKISHSNQKNDVIVYKKLLHQLEML